MRLGFAVQLGTVRFLGTFLDDPAAVPAGVTADLARQLAIANPGCLAQYDAGRVRWLHAAEIRERHGYREFTDPFARFRLARGLYALCWTGTDRPSVLFDRATAWLVTEKVLLPGASVLERLISRIRARAAHRLWRALARDVTREQRAQLNALLLAGEGGESKASSQAHARQARVAPGAAPDGANRHGGSGPFGDQDRKTSPPSNGIAHPSRLVSPRPGAALRAACPRLSTSWRRRVRGATTAWAWGVAIGSPSCPGLACWQGRARRRSAPRTRAPWRARAPCRNRAVWS